MSTDSVSRQGLLQLFAFPRRLSQLPAANGRKRQFPPSPAQTLLMRRLL